MKRGQEDEERQREQDAEHGGGAYHNLLRLLAAQALLKPEVELRRLLLLVLGQEAGRIGQGLHALGERVHKREHAANEGPAQHGVLILDEG